MYQKTKIKRHEKCTKQCPICPFVLEGKEIKGNNYTWKINKELTCKTENIVYMIKCTKENWKENIYIGESERSLKHRISEHIQYIKSNNRNQATGFHFNLPGHSLHDIEVSDIEQPKSSDTEYRKERESYIIRKFNSYYSGMNRMP